MPRHEKSHGALILVIDCCRRLTVQLAASGGARVQTAFCTLVAIGVALVKASCYMAAVATNVFSCTALGQFDTAEGRSLGQSTATTFLAISTARLGALRFATVTAKNGGGIDRGCVAMVMPVIVVMPVIACGRGGIRRVAVAAPTAAVATP